MSSRPTMTDEDSQLPTTDATSERRSNRSALAMVHATDAIDYLLNNSISDATLLESHRMFMANAGVEAMYASRYRKVQHWIAGSDYSPRGALYVPPPPQEIPQLMQDLLTFSNRRDIPVLVQASIMHIRLITESIRVASLESGVTAQRLVKMPSDWAVKAGQPRSHSTAGKIMKELSETDRDIPPSSLLTRVRIPH